MFLSGLWAKLVKMLQPPALVRAGSSRRGRQLSTRILSEIFRNLNMGLKVCDLYCFCCRHLSGCSMFSQSRALAATKSTNRTATSQPKPSTLKLKPSAQSPRSFNPNPHQQNHPINPLEPSVTFSAFAFRLLGCLGCFASFRILLHAATCATGMNVQKSFNVL